MSGLYLVTGGAGFIGSHIVDALVGRGNKVRVIDNLSTGRLENIRHLLDDIEFIEADLRDQAATSRAVAGVEVVLHQAAIPSVAFSIQDPIGCAENNLTATLQLLLACRESGVRRFVYASSCAVYGNPETVPIPEGAEPAPLSPYAATKLTGEHYCQLFYRLYGLETVSLRYFNVYGPRQDPSSPYAAVIPKFIKSALARAPLVIYGDGEQSRDFVFVETVVEANLLACEKEGVGGEVFNIGSGEGVSINRLVQLLREVINVEIEVRHAAPRPGDIRDSVADIQKVKLRLGFSPAISLQEGLRRSVAWFRGDA